MTVSTDAALLQAGRGFPSQVAPARLRTNLREVVPVVAQEESVSVRPALNLVPDTSKQGVLWTPAHAAKHVRAAYGREVASVFATGQALLEAKDHLTDRNWGHVVDKLLPFSWRTADRYLKIATHPGLVSIQHPPQSARWRS